MVFHYFLTIKTMVHHFSTVAIVSNRYHIQSKSSHFFQVFQKRTLLWHLLYIGPLATPRRCLRTQPSASLVCQLVLPCQNAPPQSASWSTIVGIPNAWMSLLLANQQISGEAREVLYGDSAFTFAISTDQISFLHHSEIMKSFSTFMATHSIYYIKNWQVDLQFDRLYDGDNRARSILAPYLGSTTVHAPYWRHT